LQSQLIPQSITIQLKLSKQDRCIETKINAQKTLVGQRNHFNLVLMFQIQPTLKRSLVLLFISHLILDFYTGIWPIYKTIAQVDLAKAGLIAGMSGFIGEVMQVFFGYFSDRGYRKRVMMLGLTLASCVLFITYTQDIWSSFFVLILLMLGSGSYHPAGAGFAGLLSADHKGRNILFFSCGGAIGLGISQLTFTKIFQSFNGHALILFIPVCLLLCIFAFYPFPEQKENRKLSWKEFFAPIRKAKRSLFLLYLTQVFNFTLFTAFIFLLPDLMRAKGCHSWLCFGGGHFSFILGSALVMIPVGFLCDKYGHKIVILTTIIFALLTLYTFLMQSELSLLQTMLFLISLGGFMGTINPILVSWGNKIVPESPSTVSGLLMGFAWCLSNFGATWAGLIAKSIAVNPITITLGLIGLLLFGGFFLILFVPSAKPVSEPTVE
jgi:FSR family fosmidomycin resistance protein-like MFS transporter